MLHWRERLHPDGLHCWWSVADQVYEECSVVRIQGSKDLAVLQALRADISADGVALGADRFLLRTICASAGTVSLRTTSLLGERGTPAFLISNLSCFTQLRC
jgi:hypothetical protein